MLITAVLNFFNAVFEFLDAVSYVCLVRMTFLLNYLFNTVHSVPLLAGMWLVGVSCLVDVISSSTSTVNVLMDEFEAAGGKRVFVQILTGMYIKEDIVWTEFVYYNT